MKLKLGICQQELMRRMRYDRSDADKAETQRLLLAFNNGNLEPILETITLKEVIHGKPNVASAIAAAGLSDSVHQRQDVGCPPGADGTGVDAGNDAGAAEDGDAKAD